ncbi:MAG: flagellar biosynthesis repressor FlbT, partial [Hyphomicrobiales bacterium]
MATSPARLVYLAVQMMYLNQDIEKHHEGYFKLVTDILQAAPSLAPEISAINNNILTGSLYKGLKDAKSLILKEDELLNHARTDSNTSLSGD